MNYNELLEIAAKAIKIPVDEAEKHCKKLEEYDAYYFWNPVRGGIAVIINSAGEKLGATSSVSFERHLREYLNGRRN